MRDLLKHLRGPVIVIWDRINQHRSAAVPARRDCLIRIANDSRAFRGRHASFPTRRDEACFALTGQSMAPACGSTAIRITCAIAGGAPAGVRTAVEPSGRGVV